MRTPTKDEKAGLEVLYNLARADVEVMMEGDAEQHGATEKQLYLALKYLRALFA